MRARRSGSRLRYVVRLRYAGVRAANSAAGVGRLILHPFYAETELKLWIAVLLFSL